MTELTEYALVSRRMFTGTDNTLTAGAVLVRDGRIVDVARHVDADRLGVNDIIDVLDKPLLPGFVDPHAHSEVLARIEADTVDCRAPERRTIPDVIATLRANVDKVRNGWLVGQANLFFDQKLEEGRLPTRQELDRASTEIAIALRCGGHLTVLNSKALEVAGITRDTGSGHGSITGHPSVDLGPDGIPTGTVREMDALLPLPRISTADLEGAIASTMLERFIRNGVTTVGEIGESRDGVQAFDRLLAGGAALPRMFFYLWVPGFAPLEEAIEFTQTYTPLSGSLLRLHGIKVFADGGYSAKSAAMTRPYKNHPEHFGEIALDTPDIQRVLSATDHHGLQLAIHANGDRAQLAACKAVASARVGSTRPHPQTRIEHAGNFVPEYDELTAAWRAADVVPVPQPVFLYNFGEFVPEYVGEYALHGQFPFRSLLDDGWPVSGSSDVWIGSEILQTNPFLSIQSAVGRRSFHGHLIEPEQAITVPEALRMHTLNAAIALGVSDQTGSLEPGKLADLIVLDSDPGQIDAEDLLDVRVEQVYRGGSRLI
ncbi:amidohydrolase [Microbacterium aurum]